MSELTQLGRFSIVGSLGQGGMGRVYRAHDPELGRDVAIKVLRPDARDPETSRVRLMREAKAMARLAHPNVITVHEVGRHDDDVFVVMEVVGGGTLTNWLATPRTSRAVVEVIAQAADGLAAAHAAGLVHRDIKPDNILIGEDARARITDFGLVGVDASASEPTDEPLTHTGMRLGTIGYMAPEQIEGAPATEQSDQFGLCATAYEALAGTRPFPGTTYREIALATTRGTLAPSRAAIPDELLAVIRRGLAVAPADRWPDLAAFASALREIGGTSATTRSQLPTTPSAPAPLAVPAPSTAAPASRGWLAAGLAIAISGGTIGFVVTRGGDEPLPRVVEPPGTAPVRGAPVFERPGCAHDPTFLSEDELVYGYANGDAGDVYVRHLARGTERRLTTTPTTAEHHVQAAIGERAVTFVVQEQGAQGFWARKLGVDDGKVTDYPSATMFLNAGAAWIRDRIYYVIGDGATLASLTANTTAEVFKLSSGYIWTMAPSADGRHLALNLGELCVLDLDARPGTAPACSKPPEASYGRYLIDPTAQQLYYGAWDGIHAFERATGKDRLVVTGAGPGGGMGLSPSGKRLAWSDCQPQIALTELGTNRVVHRESLTGPATNQLGAWVFVRETPATSVLAYREPEGHIHELTSPKQLPSSPALEPTGERVVFVRADAPGLWLAFGVRQRPLQQLTTGTDLNPLWIDRERVAFTRVRADGKPEVWTLELDGAPQRAFDRVRQTIDKQPGGDLVLLFNDDRTRLFLWNPRTGDEREIPQPSEFHGAPLSDADLAPDGTSIVVMRGTEVWRFAVAGGPPTRLWAPPVGHGIYGLEVDASDHVIIGDAQDAGTIFVADLP